MPELKDQLLIYLQKRCNGKTNAMKVRDLAYEFRCTDREIRDELRRLNLDGHPVVTLTEPPFGVFFASNQEDIDRYWHNLNSRTLKLLERMRAVSRIRTKDFLSKQLELF